MRKKWKIYLKICNQVLLVFLTIIGFNYCKKRNNNIMDEYGTPHADFIIYGKVRSKATNEPIEGIKGLSMSDSVFTNEKGDFVFNYLGFFPTDQSFTIKFNDVDSSANGLFEDYDTTIEFTDPIFTGGDEGWYEGSTEKEVEVKLTPKTNDL